MKEQIASNIVSLLEEIVTLPSTIILLAVLMVMGIMVLDSLGGQARKKKAAAGLASNSQLISVDGTSSLPLKTYVSDIQGLAGRPDAIIRENSFIIPVERKPLANKIRDRYVAQLLVYMRLVEEFEGKKPPYGYLILGPKCRSVKIYNTPERQAWLQKILDEMNAILKGGESKATPHPKKCQKCQVKNYCAFKAANPIKTNKQSSQLLAKRVVH